MQRKINKQKKQKYIIGLKKGIITLLSILILFWIITFFFNKENPPITTDIKYKGDVKVLIHNGCGIDGAGASIARILRNAHIDVLNIGNADSRYYAHTLIIDRQNNRSKAENLAFYLGISTDLIITHKDMEIPSVEDVLLILGKDYKQVFNITKR